MWKFLLLGTTFAADLLARVGTGIGQQCICGLPCVMNGGGSGVCQVNGECAVNVLPPDCDGGFEISNTFTLGKVCPMLRCAAPPDCPTALLWTPTLANGCPGCPRCRDTVIAKTVDDTAFGVASDFKLAPPRCPLIACIPLACPSFLQETPINAAGCKLCPVCKPDSFTSHPPCPVVRCLPPGCPVSQQETPTDENGCSLCPKCKGISTIPPVFTAVQRQPLLNANFDLDLDFTGVLCPVLSCFPLNCPPSQQVPTTMANGCPGCPKCLNFVAVAEAKLAAPGGL